MLSTMYLVGIFVATLFAAALADLGNLQPHSASDQGSSGEAGTGTPGTATSQSTALLPLSQNDDDPPLQMSEFCFFGKFPSATCRFRCHLMNLEAYCDESLAKCLCQPETTKPEVEVPTQDVFAKPETHKDQEKEKAKKPEESQKIPEGTPTHDTTSFTIPMQTAVQEPEEDQNKHHVVFYIFDLNKIFGPQTNDTKAEATQTEVPEPQTVPAGWTFQHFVAIFIVILLIVLITLELMACYRKQRSKTNDMETIFKNIPMPNKA